MSSVLSVCLISFGLSPLEQAAVDEVDLIEINHSYDEQGRLVFDQVIFYDWCPQDGRYHVRDWRLLKKSSQVPLRSGSGGLFVTVWQDSKHRDVLRKVRASMVRETWTQFDPEMVEREFLPVEQRRKLSEIVVKPGLAAENTRTGRPDR